MGSSGTPLSFWMPGKSEPPRHCIAMDMRRARLARGRQ